MVIDLKEEITNAEWLELLTALSHEYIHDEPQTIGESLLLPYDTDFPDEGILVKTFETEGRFMHISLDPVGGKEVSTETKEAFEEDIYSFIIDRLGYSDSY
ncbi:MAG: hypothetical protein EOO05_05520 [Chitinophagaceae bacterium]|nr:MAG: hypothetical protein EOO05_05520 [Chitinophagaceae bacterium]